MADLTIHTYPWKTTDAQALLEENDRLRADGLRMVSKLVNVADAFGITDPTDMHAFSVTARESGAKLEMLDRHRKTLMDCASALSRPDDGGRRYDEMPTEIKALREEVERLEERESKLNHLLCYAEQFNDQARADSSKMSEALEKYGAHSHACISVHNAGHKCDCGLTAALAIRGGPQNP